MDRSDRVCVIGAGPCGLTACKNLAEAGILYDCLEQQDDVGGIWYYGSPHSSIFQSTQLISSKRLTEFAGFPMPSSYPHYPHHEQLLDYLRRYADALPTARPDSIQHQGDRRAGHGRRHSGGDRQGTMSHATQPSSLPTAIMPIRVWPEIPGTFSGKLLHSRDYKTPDVVRDARVLVIGGGNSACDIAVEATHHAASVTLSLRRGYHFLPKFLFGAPLDRCGATIDRLVPAALDEAADHEFSDQRRRGPPGAIRLASTRTSVICQPSHCELPRAASCGPPSHHRAAGRHTPGTVSTVCFADGSRQDFDVVICGTGFHVSFPFVRDDALAEPDRRHSGAVPARLSSSRETTSFVSGMIQPNGGIWRLADLQMQLVARYLVAMRRAPRVAAWFRGGNPGGPRRPLDVTAIFHHLGIASKSNILSFVTSWNAGSPPGGVGCPGRRAVPSKRRDPGIRGM